MPIFFDAPYSYIHASTDIGEVVDWIKGKFLVTKEGNKYLAVLHNRNKMVNAFASTEWVAGSEGAVLSRSVTSCAGMTAYLVGKPPMWACVGLRPVVGTTVDLKVTTSCTLGTRKTAHTFLLAAMESSRNPGCRSGARA